MAPLRATLCVGLVLSAGLAGHASAEELRVFATGVFALSLPEIARGFEAETGHRLAITTGNAGVVAAKLAAGEPAGVVMSSSTGIDRLIASRTLVADSKIEIGRMRLGLGVPAGTALPVLMSPAGLRTLLLEAPAIAYVDPSGGGTAGAFIEKVFMMLGIADAVHAKAIVSADGSGVASALAARKATAGLTQASELLGAPGVAFAGLLPDEVNSVSLYAAALAAPERGEAARDFLRFLKGPIARAALRRAGWELARSPL